MKFGHRSYTIVPDLWFLATLCDALITQASPRSQTSLEAGNWSKEERHDQKIAL